ncbi:TPA: Rap1a/Tai family immunity protein [Yersinia enterocolitica]
MMKKVIVLFLLLVNIPAQAAFVSGNDILDWLDSSNRVNNGSRTPKDLQKDDLLSGYIRGIADMGKYDYFCPDAEVTAGQLINIVQKYINENPKESHKSGALLSTTALKNAFPCKVK